MPQKSLGDRGIRLFLIGVGFLLTAAIFHSLLDLMFLPSIMFFPGIVLVTVGLYMYAYSSWRQSQSKSHFRGTLKPPQ